MVIAIVVYILLVLLLWKMMTFTVQEMCFEVKDMDVLVDVCPAEPDVGFFGNGKVSISILDVETGIRCRKIGVLQ